MTLGQYRWIKLVFIIVIAIIVSQSIIFKNYLIPITSLIVSSLLLIYLRRQVKEVIADERDYAIGGKSAFLALQIYSWVAVIGMLIFYAFRDFNPAYESIGLTLAFSTCFLMFLFGVIFRYYSKFSLTNKKLLYIILISVLFFVVAIFTLRFFSGEDNWIYVNGNWTEHGHSDFPAPSFECE
ncbi:MAG: hypothetical protein COU29_03035 [Candidatus Magasanikbacteria bacterium CG10_big_fil_rev_8_21_14_0_10_36_32]|uniref:Uncharacterized protein n=1 Tax=Candidatus Magasanikbacteria bacterium CG10_big_fil_rev_8_21_14_0_10_36_32 TaxID=1974646 RepID=A0A2M6W5Y5_9BACT|nr:MAG: hypothetical protein COU29_03035 [Candidatus Magasanikbacteria bacterium CG10_big_fil_rev_8_21_14_0_10_36_32]